MSNRERSVPDAFMLGAIERMLLKQCQVLGQILRSHLSCVSTLAGLSQLFFSASLPLSQPEKRGFLRSNISCCACNCHYHIGILHYL